MPTITAAMKKFSPLLLALLSLIIIELSCAFSQAKISTATHSSAFNPTKKVTSKISLSALSSRESVANKSIELQPVRKVAIIGSGICGLSLAHALCKSKEIEINIFDARTELDERIGSGIQLTGGMAALREISPQLYRNVADSCFPLERVVSRCRPWFGNNGEPWKLLELDIQTAIRSSGVEELITEDGEVLAYTILRGTLQRILHEELMTEHDIQVQFGSCRPHKGCCSPENG